MTGSIPGTIPLIQGSGKESPGEDGSGNGFSGAAGSGICKSNDNQPARCTLIHPPEV